VLSEALHISKGEAKRRIKQAELLGPRTALTGESLPPKLPNVAAAQARGEIGAEHLNCPDSVARLTRFSVSGTPHSAASATHRAGRRSSADLRQVHEAIDAQETRGPRKPRQSPLTTVTTSVQSPTAGQDMR
jgi:hypothetical protein